MRWNFNENFWNSTKIENFLILTKFVWKFSEKFVEIFRVECSEALLPETRDQPFMPISSTTIEPIVLKMYIYVVLLSKTALF